MGDSTLSRHRYAKTRCPICDSVEGCDHTMYERVKALKDYAYRDEMRAADPLYQLQLARRRKEPSP